MYNYSADKIGYYQVSEFKTYSKLEALQLGKHLNKFPEWNFNRQEFDAANWAQEPPIDLWELYKQRCRQIRENYDYVVLFYSGGSDSTNILDAWLECDLKLDEIATLWSYEGSGSKHNWMESEITKVALPRIQKLDNKDIKFRLIDQSQMISDYLNKTKGLWAYINNHHLSPNNGVRSILRNEIKEWADIIDSGKKLCFVWGFEKTQVFYENGKHYAQFFDIMDNCVSPYAQRNNVNGWYDELFYWTPAMPEIAFKQAHVIKRFVETCNDARFYENSKNRYGYNPKLDMYLTDDAVKRIIYPRWDPTTFCIGKSPSKVYSARDAWFWSGNTEAKDLFVNMSNAYLKRLDSYWLNDPKNLSKGIKGHCSPKYFL